MINIQSFGILLAFLISFPQCGEKESIKPNIVLIYADDLGIGLLGHEGQQIITTPHIDQLAKEGIRFTNAYSNMLCAPARASLISGLHDCHANRFEITGGALYKQLNFTDSAYRKNAAKINQTLTPVPNDQVFLAEVAKNQGYVTAQIGKLEWGFTATHEQMTRHGWEYYYGYLDHARAHGFYPPFIFENGNMVSIEGNTLMSSGKSKEPETVEAFAERHDMTEKKQYSQDLFMDKVLRFITANKDNPFFLFFPTQLPHGPVAIPAVHLDFINDDRLTEIEKEYASMVKMLDDNVGTIMEKLKELGLDDNTLVIFTADNGHEIYYSQEGRITKPYSNIETGERFDNLDQKYHSQLAGDVFDGNGGRAGLKRSNLQGGINVPLVVRWPSKIAQGQVSNQLVANYDLMVTLAEITGFSKPMKTDGISFYQALTEGKTKKTHEYVTYASYTGPTLITNDGWKIRAYMKEQVFELFYLHEDFKEENDLSRVYPEKFNALKKELLKTCEGDFVNGLFTSKLSQIRVK